MDDSLDDPGKKRKSSADLGQKRPKKKEFYQGPVTPGEENAFVEVVSQSNPVQNTEGNDSMSGLATPNVFP